VAVPLKSRTALSAVERLLFAGCPTAVPRCIRTIVIWVTVQSMFRRRLRSHVPEKGGKVRTPLFTHDDASIFVVVPDTFIRIVAAPFRGSPSLVFRSHTLAVAIACMSVFRVTLPGRVFVQASATPRVSCTQRVTATSVHSSAVAATEPNDLVVSPLLRLPDYNQAPEPLPGDVAEAIHRYTLSSIPEFV
jgi:hypothetical protein